MTDIIIKKLQETFPPLQALYIGIYLCTIQLAESKDKFHITKEDLIKQGVSEYLKTRKHRAMQIKASEPSACPTEPSLPLLPPPQTSGTSAQIADSEATNTLIDAFAQYEALLDWGFIRNSSAVPETIEYCRGYLKYEIKSIDDMNRVIGALIESESGPSNIKTTPRSIYRLVSAILPQQQYKHIAEFCSGVSLFGAELAGSLRRKGWADEVAYYGAEINGQLCMMAELILALNQIAPADIKAVDVLADTGHDAYPLILSDISQNVNTTYTIRYGDSRFRCIYEKPTIFYDWAYIINILSMMEERGRACIVVRKGALVRQNERGLRRYIVENHMLEAVITLPASLYPGSALSTELLVLRGKMATRQREEIFFMDLSDCAVRKNRYQNEIREDILVEIEQEYGKEETISTYGRYITAGEIAENNYSLNSLVYLRKGSSDADGIPLSEIAEVIRGIQIERLNKSSDTGRIKYSLINMKDVVDGRLDYGGCARIAVNEKWIGKYDICEDDILITAKGSALKIAMVGNDFQQAFISSNISRIRVDKRKYHPYLLYEFLNSDEGRRALECCQTGTTIRVLNPSVVKNLKAPFIGHEIGSRCGEALKRNQIEYETEQKRLDLIHRDRRRQLLEELHTNMKT